MSARFIDIRVPVCVTAAGDWNAVSWRGGMESGEDIVQTESPFEGCESRTHTVFVTARVPVPTEPESIAGEVSDARG